LIKDRRIRFSWSDGYYLSIWPDHVNLLGPALLGEATGELAPALCFLLNPV